MPRFRRSVSSLRRKAARRILLASVVFFAAYLGASVWFVRHPKAWRDAKKESWPRFAAAALEYLGSPARDLSDAFGLTGEDATASATRPAPAGRIDFAGLPVRRGAPAPDDIQILRRGDFAIGWSPSLKHPVWCAYHVPAEPAYEAGARPNFRKDPAVKSSPPSSAYARSGYDRGHMVPNYAIATRFGPASQGKTFLTTNISPQSPGLNRGVWRDVEHRIAEFWTRRWGEIWVVVGAISNGQETLSGTDVNVPESFYQIAVAQSGGEIRAVAVLFDQGVEWRAWPTDYIVSIDEIEKLSGLDFFTGLDPETERVLEAAVPTRLWPVGFVDAFRQLLSHNE